MDLANLDELDDATCRLVRASWEGAEQLAATLSHTAVGPPADSGPDVDGSALTGTPGQAMGVWLSSVAVEGFRGIGGRTELLLNPGPGLTLVVGRNGSGKSSFAEGLEALLTGDSLRWRDRPMAWRDGWRNLHHDGPVSVSAEFHREGDKGTTTVCRRWDNSFEESSVDCTIGENEVQFNWLGWGESLTTHKPLLSYNELGSMLEQKPSAIYDSMATVLGLERLTEARERLRHARLDAQKPGKALKAETSELQKWLEEAEEARATEAASLLTARSVDTEALRALVAGGDSTADDAMRSLAALETVDIERCRLTAQDLESAVSRLEDLGSTDAGRSRRLAGLLQAALDHHDIEGDSHEPLACPVCGEGTLNIEWRDQVVSEVGALEQEATAADEAATEVTRARQAAIAALGSPPPVVEAHAPELSAAWAEWVTPPDQGWTEHSLVERLKQVEALNTQIELTASGARAELAKSDEAWRPYAERIVAWLQHSETAARADEQAKQLKAGEDFYKNAEARLRAERFEPIAERAAELWSVLRQQSNVTLERVALEGTTTQRRVALDVTVDGTDTSALGVMSQGELHALALALFLPRVTAAESPFRFVLIDDPVQAMDAARVDGLARVLDEVAADRQVVVFTHDDRLPASCRRLGVKADVVQVHRQSSSRVATAPSESPALDAIGNAYTLAKTTTIPSDLKRHVVPAQCRMALESQLRDLVWSTMLSGGQTHAQIDELLADADTTTDLIGLWLLGRAAAKDEVYDAVDLKRPGSSGQIRFLQKAVHDPPHDLDPEALTGTVRSMMREFAQG